VSQATSINTAEVTVPQGIEKKTRGPNTKPRAYTISPQLDEDEDRYELVQGKIANLNLQLEKF